MQHPAPFRDMPARTCACQPRSWAARPPICKGSGSDCRCPQQRQHPRPTEHHLQLRMASRFCCPGDLLEVPRCCHRWGALQVGLPEPEPARAEPVAPALMAPKEEAGQHQAAAQAIAAQRLPAVAEGVARGAAAAEGVPRPPVSQPPPWRLHATQWPAAAAPAGAAPVCASLPDWAHASRQRHAGCLGHGLALLQALPTCRHLPAGDDEPWGMLQWTLRHCHFLSTAFGVAAFAR